jgi:AraC-like DNA-binding protein
VTERLAPILNAKRMQSGRANVTACALIPDEARYRLRNHVRHKLSEVLEYISKHYASPIGEREIAQLCGMSVFNFSRAFRAAYQTTFRDYLTDYRLKQSKRLLGNRNVPITDVAAMSGFNDPSYFARLFKRRLGASPTTYRMSLSNATTSAASEHAKLS